LTLTAIDRLGDCEAILHDGASLRARHEVLDVNAGWAPVGLSRFLSDLDEDWRGWKGGRVWESIGRELKLTCAHDGIGHVSVVARLRARGWVAAITITLDVGGLGDLARDAASWESASREYTGSDPFYSRVGTVPAARGRSPVVVLHNRCLAPDIHRTGVRLTSAPGGTVGA
jgi:hypothetical protein